MRGMKYAIFIYLVLLIATISGGTSYDHAVFASKVGDDGALKNEIVSDSSIDLPEYKPSDTEVKNYSGLTPATIEIPALKLNVPVQHVGQTENGQMGVPDNIQETGWYQNGFKPGESGNAVIAGHVDGQNKPGAFFNLKKLQKGHRIIIRNEQNEKRTFVIKNLKEYDPETAPVDEIFGYNKTPGLNLITCTGVFNHETGNYEERLVVHAELIE